jgi:hypothetical protein
MTGLITAEMQSIVGRPYERRRSFPIDATAIRWWAMAVYHPEAPPPRHWDPATPGGLEAPAEFNPFAWKAAEEVTIRSDGTEVERSTVQVPIEQRMGVAPPPLKTTMNGGLDVTYGAPMRVGDVISGTTAIGGYTEREGKSGPMLFTVLESRWTNQHDQLVKVSCMTIIRR